MEARRTINKLTGRIASRLAGALGLVLVLSLIAGNVMPAYAVEPPPEMPHQFYGTVKFNGDLVAAGTLVEVFVDDVKEAETTVDIVGRYGYDPIFRVPGTAGATVTFYVDGIEAEEHATWESGKVQKLNLTIHEEPEPPVQYTLTISSTTGGSVTTPGEGVYTYYAATVVDLLAEAEAGYQFAKWTASAGTFGDANAAETTFTMPAQDVTITAHFGVVYELTMAADTPAYGEAIDVAAKGAYPAGAEVSIKAVANPGYGFVDWTAPAGDFDDATAEETTFTMPDQAVTVTAHFGVTYNLAMTADPVVGGEAIDVGDKGAYAEGATVRIKAEPAAGYGFVNWTADPTVTFNDATAEETTFIMLDQAVTITAHFGEAYALTMAADPVGGGDAIDVAAKGAYAEGATVRINAVANPGYGFGNWTANPTVTFSNATAAETTFTMLDQAVTVTAHFEDVTPPTDVPTVTTEAATDISTYAGSVHMSYTMGGFSSVEVRFACKRSTDPVWFYTVWVSRTTDGNYTEVLTSLISETGYEFKAQLKYNDTVIEGTTRQFTTAPGSSMGFDDFLSYFGCFIATAAYGTPTAEQIDVLREFRDVVLLQSPVGSQFVALYYRLSPPVADFIAKNDLLRTLVREFLIDPIVWIVEATGDIWRN
jgi:uncharacterized repeat protein (TIGR02543 family)